MVKEDVDHSVILVCLTLDHLWVNYFNVYRPLVQNCTQKHGTAEVVYVTEHLLYYVNEHNVGLVILSELVGFGNLKEVS